MRAAPLKARGARPNVSQVSPNTASAAPITVKAIAIALEWALQKSVICVHTVFCDCSGSSPPVGLKNKASSRGLSVGLTIDRGVPEGVRLLRLVRRELAPLAFEAVLIGVLASGITLSVRFRFIVGRGVPEGVRLFGLVRRELAPLAFEAVLSGILIASSIWRRGEPGAARGIGP